MRIYTCIGVKLEQKGLVIRMRTIRDIAYGNCELQKLDIYLPEGEAKNVLIYFHGGGIENGDSIFGKLIYEWLTDMR